MFYEEQTINGITYFRTTKMGQWQVMPYEMLQERYAELLDECRVLSQEITEWKIKFYDNQ